MRISRHGKTHHEAGHFLSRLGDAVRISRHENTANGNRGALPGLCRIRSDQPVLVTLDQGDQFIHDGGDVVVFRGEDAGDPHRLQPLVIRARNDTAHHHRNMEGIRAPQFIQHRFNHFHM